jgi:hypothetical protein
MKEQVRAIEGNPNDINTPAFCIKFKPADATILDPMTPVGPRDAVRRLRRYTLVKLEGKRRAVARQWPARGATEEQGRIGTVSRKAVPATTMDLAHKQLQHDLYRFLVALYPLANVAKEENFADIKLERDGKVTVIEVKTDPRPLQAIRNAVGQLLEYAFRCEQNGQKIDKLLVVGPGEVDDLARSYIEHLKTTRGLPIDYLCYRPCARSFSI